MMAARYTSTGQGNMITDATSNTTEAHGPEGLDAWGKVPTEIWQKIFGNLSENHKDVLNARVACRYWRNIIDEHIEFKVHLNDKNKTWNKMAHVRVKSVCVHRFRKRIPRSLQLYKDLNLLTKLHLYSDISRKNFLWLVEHAPNLEYLKFQGGVLCEKSIFKATNQPEQLILTNFWNRLKQLVFSNGHFEEERVSVWITNFTQVMTTFMPNLKFVGFKIQFANTLPWFVRFLLLNPSVTDVDFGLQSTFSTPKQLPAPDPINMKDLKNIQLKDITLRVMDVSKYGKELILSIINAQKSLVHLDACESPAWSSRESVVYFDNLSELVRNSYSTLTTVSFHSLQLASHLDASMFEKLTALKTLVLYPQNICNCSDAYQVQNLACLPQSLEKLTIEGLKFSENDLIAILMSKKLDNVRLLKLVGTGSYRLTSELFENLTKKVKLRYFKVGPVTLQDFRVEIVGKKQYVRLGNGIRLEATRPNWVSKKSAVLNLVVTK